MQEIAAKSEAGTGTSAKIRVAWGAALLVLGFAAGWICNSRLTIAVDGGTQRGYMADRGDAPAAARAGVLASLQAFQDGYAARDPRRIDSFMQSLFPRDEPIVLTGTDAGEWREGYEPVRRSIAADWRSWGDVQLDVRDSVVSESGGIAWLATVGKVRMTHSSRPIRFTAVLARKGDKWLFRQVQFQWDERPVRLSDLALPNAVSSLTLR
ncbi:MAG TPA: nuclear transport factor 2 family protein [Candidatus Acidoferrales bacterium]|nr:nuclear transport factor 2 family protein [Candidatus Acidoferrales bacterium]